MLNEEHFDADEILREPDDVTQEKYLDDDDEDNIEEIDFHQGHAQLLEEQHDLFEEY